MNEKKNNAGGKINFALALALVEAMLPFLNYQGEYELF